jgi:hypothetical protein
MVESARKSVGTKGKAEGPVQETGAASKGRKQDAAQHMMESAKQDAITEDNQAKGATERTESLVQEPKAASKGRKQDAVQHMAESVKPDAVTTPDAIIDENQANLAAFVEANEAIMAGMATLSAEVVGFGTKRLRDNMERTESLLACRDPEQAFRVQCEFFEQATQQYLDQANQVMTIMAAITQNFLAPFEERTKATLRELNDQED